VDHFRHLSFLTDYDLGDGFVAACHGPAVSNSAITHSA